jgi:hypothetical protein
MNRVTEHAWLLLFAAVGAAICLEVLNIERATQRAPSEIASNVPQPWTPVGSKRMRTAANDSVQPDPEPEQISAQKPSEPVPPKLISPPVEVKRPPKKSVVAAADAPPAKRSDAASQQPAFVRSILAGVSAVLGQN